MRNSVKVVIDAYDGTLTAYVSAPHDPLIRTWAAIFPGIFLPLDSMPADLRAHIRVSGRTLSRCRPRSTPPTTWTRRRISTTARTSGRSRPWTRAAGAVPFMRHIVMRLPEEQQAEYIYMVPFTPRGKDNLAAWMVARNDGAEYGKLRVYRLPRQSLVYGPSQIENRINQDTEISRQISLWDQRGSKVIRGDLLVIPIEQSLLYVQPLYLQAEKGGFPSSSASWSPMATRSSWTKRSKARSARCSGMPPGNQPAPSRRLLPAPHHPAPIRSSRRTRSRRAAISRRLSTRSATAIGRGTATS